MDACASVQPQMLFTLPSGRVGRAAQRRNAMSNVMKVPLATEHISEEDRLRIVARRALAPISHSADFPLDGLDIGAALPPKQVRLPAETRAQVQNDGATSSTGSK
jgi:hypothetical protein